MTTTIATSPPASDARNLHARPPRVAWAAAVVVAALTTFLFDFSVWPLTWDYLTGHTTQLTGPGLERLWRLSDGFALLYALAIVIAVRFPLAGFAGWVLTTVATSVAWSLAAGGASFFGLWAALPAIAVTAAWPWWLPLFTSAAGPRPAIWRSAHDRLRLQVTVVLAALVFGYGVLATRSAQLDFGDGSTGVDDSLMVFRIWARLMPVVVLLAWRKPRLAAGLGVLIGVVCAAQVSFFPIHHLVIFVGLLAAGAVAWSICRVSAGVLFTTAYAVSLCNSLGWVGVATWPRFAIDVWHGGLSAEPVAVFQFAVTYLVATLLALGLGQLLRSYLDRSVDLDVREGRVSERDAVVAERARLASDLHDVVAHHVSLIAIRAETAPFTHPNLDAETKALLAEIAGDARRALDELRGVLGLLRRTEADGGAATAPLPGWAEIPELIERNRSAGLEIAYDDQRDSGADLTEATGRGYVLYRVLQEALTNARRHGDAGPVKVTLAEEPPQLRVSNAVSTESATSNSGAGTGIVGMRERVEAIGGTLVASQQHDEFVVEVRLP